MNCKFVWIEKDLGHSGYVIIKYQKNDYEHFHSKFEMKYNMIDASVLDIINHFIDNGYTFLGVLRPDYN